MQIRFATLEDIPACVAVGRIMHQSTRFAVYDYDADRVARKLESVICVGQQQQRSHCFFVAETADGEIIGALIGCIERHFFSELKVASVIQYVALPGRRMGGAGLRLLNAFRRWAENRGAFELSVGINSGTQLARLDRYLKRMGFSTTGGNYTFSLNSDS